MRIELPEVRQSCWSVSINCIKEWENVLTCRTCSAALHFVTAHLLSQSFSFWSCCSFFFGGGDANGTLIQRHQEQLKIGSHQKQAWLSRNYRSHLDICRSQLSWQHYLSRKDNNLLMRTCQLVCPNIDWVQLGLDSLSQARL